MLLAGGLWSATIAPLQITPPAIAQSGNPRALQLRANATQANAKTGVVVASGNVQIDYPARDIKATAAQATYYSREGRMVLSGNVYILQEGNSLRGEVITYLINEGRFVARPRAGKQVEAIYLLPP
ncbi:OstA family protein, partial [filamentous cyanobacterium LEGE 11480]|nr:OstA family protein [Romeriopsis navalis LEGE 11480]